MRLAAGFAVLVLLASAPARAEERIAYANIETILALLPETKALAQGIDSLGRGLAKELDAKEAAAQQKVEEARRAQASGATEETLEKYRQELRAMEEEIRKQAEAADDRLADHREAGVRPLLHKLELTIREVAKEEGYTLVLNSVDGNGNSIVLYGEDTNDITERVLKKLGITPPKPAAKTE